MSGVMHIMKSCFAGMCALAILMTPSLVSAQGKAPSLALTLAPPLFQITQAPGTEWASTLRVVNTNDYDLEIALSVRDFHPDGETGNAVFEETPTALPGDARRMSGWIILPQDLYTISRGTTAEIPFVIRVPSDADPGGHYAAIIVGTVPTAMAGGSGAGVSSAVTSLFFVRVPGDVIEEGNIRDFYPESTFVQSPDQRFVLRFENTGNVHLLPQGNITLTNMWGKERGRIDINEKNTFGNVLPHSTRKFEFDWHGEQNPFEVGRYKAEAVLVSGVEARTTVSRSVYFWVIPIKPVLAILGSLTAFIWFIMWSVRRYIRKALALERDRLGTTSAIDAVSAVSSVTRRAPPITLDVLRLPLKSDGIESRVRESRVGDSARRPGASSFGRLFRRYQPIIAFAVVLIIGFSLIGWYFVEVFQSERTYQMEQLRDK